MHSQIKRGQSDFVINWYWYENRREKKEDKRTKNCVLTRCLHTSVSLLIMTFSDLGGPEKGRCVVVVVILSCLGRLSTIYLQYLGSCCLPTSCLLVDVFVGVLKSLKSSVLSLVQFLLKEIGPWHLKLLLCGTWSGLSLQFCLLWVDSRSWVAVLYKVLYYFRLPKLSLFQSLLIYFLSYKIVSSDAAFA